MVVDSYRKKKKARHFLATGLVVIYNEKIDLRYQRVFLREQQMVVIIMHEKE
jgi:hypothetical protein